MSEERMRNVLAFLNANEDIAKDLLAMQPEDAVKVLESKGISCTTDDLVHLAEELKKVQAEVGELDVEALEGVTGGGKFTFFLGVACGAAVVTAALCAPW